MNLFDTIRQNRLKAADPSQVRTTDETQKVQQLLAAKSGQAPTSGGIATSSLGEAAANDQTQQGLAGLQQQVQTQNQTDRVQEAAQAQQTQQQKQQVDLARKFDNVQSKIQTNQILNNLAQDRGQMDQNKKQAQLEQVAFHLSMQDKQYTDTLQDVGRKRRLDDDSNFREEMADLAFGQNLDFVKQQLGQNDILAASDRDFQKIISQMNIEDAQRIAATEMAMATEASDIQNSFATDQARIAATAANTQAKYNAYGQLISTGLNAYGKYEDNKTTPTYGDTNTGSTGDLRSSEAERY